MFEFDVKPGVIFVGSFPPRTGRIAKYTGELALAVADEMGPSQSVIVAAMNDRPQGYAYDSRVKLVIREDCKADYRLVAKCINSVNSGIVCVQHEFEIYGGECGDHLLEFLDTIRRPVVVTCHNVPTSPTLYQHVVMHEIVTYAHAIIAVDQGAVATMINTYGAPRNKVACIPGSVVAPSYLRIFDAVLRRVARSMDVRSQERQLRSSSRRSKRDPGGQTNTSSSSP